MLWDTIHLPGELWGVETKQKKKNKHIFCLKNVLLKEMGVVGCIIKSAGIHHGLGTRGTPGLSPAGKVPPVSWDIAHHCPTATTSLKLRPITVFSPMPPV